MNEKYWIFLLNKLCFVSRKKTSNYTYLLSYLMHKDFIWMPNFPLDSDREEDAYALRQEFLETIFDANESANFVQFCQGKKASCLEVLIALCIRICTEVYSDPSEGIEWLFWTMIDNLGLTWADDEDFDQDIVDNVLNTWLYRRYAPDGSLGNIFIFPSQKYGKIQDFTIWEQANLFMRDVN